MNVTFVTAADNWEKDKDFLDFSRKVNKTIRELEKSNVHVRAVTAVTGWGRPTVMLGYDTPEDVEGQMIKASTVTNDVVQNVLKQIGVSGV